MKKKSKFNFKQVPLRKLGNLLGKKTAASARDAELSVERPTLKTEPYSMALAGNSNIPR